MTTVHIALPTPGTVHTPFLKSMIGLTQRMREAGIGFAIESYEFSDIVFSRNYLMSAFLSNERFTHTLLLDCDMSWSSDLFFRMLSLDEPFVCAAYPQRSFPVEKFRALIEQDATKPVEQRASTASLFARSLRYNVQGALHRDGGWQSKVQGAFRTVPGAGTGFMLIRRDVPEIMVDRGAVQRLPRIEEQPRHAHVRYYDFFSHLLDRDGTLMYGEDQSFCRRWVMDCQGDIWCDTEAVITHHGDFGFRGDYARVLQG